MSCRLPLSERLSSNSCLDYRTHINHLVDMVRNSRAQIRRAARSEFARFGRAGARVARIAQNAAVNKQLVFYYFKSKDGLYEATIEDCTRELLGAFERHGPVTTAEGFRASLEDLFKTVLEREELASILTKSLDEDPAMIKALRDRVRSLISEGQMIGYFRDDADPDFVSRQVVSLIVGFQVTAPAFEGAGGRDEWIRDTAEQVRSWIAW